MFITNAICFSQPTVVWQKNYGGAAGDTATCIIQTNEGGYMVAGYTYSTGTDVVGNHGNADYWLIKLDANGAVTWKRCYGGSGRDIATSVIQNIDGTYTVCGYSLSNNGDVTDHLQSYGILHDLPWVYYPLKYETWVLKINYDGSIIWSKSFNIGDPYDGIEGTDYIENYGYSVIGTSDGGTLVGGRVYKWRNGGYFLMLTKLSATGVIQWQRIYNDGYLVYLDECSKVSLVETNVGYIVAFCGDSHELNASTMVYSNLDAWIWNVSSSGDVLWQRHHGGSQKEYVNSIQKTNDGGYVLAGSASSVDGELMGNGTHGGKDFWLFKINAAGNLVWTRCYGGTNEDIAYDVQAAADGTFYVTGMSYSNDMQVTDHNPASLLYYPFATSDNWTIKVTSAGIILWTKSYGGGAGDTGFSLFKTKDGGHVIAGSSVSTFGLVVNKGGADWLLTKFTDCPTVAIPTAPSPQVFSSYVHVSDLYAVGVNLKWYTTSTGGIPLLPTKLLPPGTSYYYVSQSTANGCESGRRTVLVTVPGTAGRGVNSFSSGMSSSTSGLRASVQPNPAKDNFQLFIPDCGQSKLIAVQMINDAGAVVRNFTCIPVDRMLHYTIERGQLPAGLYCLCFTIKGRILSIRVVLD